MTHPFANATPRRPVLVIGAGIAGLVAAHRLRLLGVPVVVCEASAHTGGRMQTVHHGESRFESGQQFYYGAYRRARALLSELGLAHRLRPAPVRGMMTWRGRVATFDKKKPWLGLLSARENLRLLWALARLSPRLLATPIFGHREADPLDRHAVDSHFLPRVGEAAFELAIRPMVCSYSFAEPEGHSLAMLAKIAKLGATSKTFALIPGNDALPGALSAGLEIRRVEVLEVVGSQDEVSGIIGRDADGGSVTLEASHVICAVPPPRARRLFEASVPALAGAMAQLPFTATLMVNFHLDRPLSKEHWVYILSRRDGHRAAFAIDCARRCPEAFPHGDSVLQVSFVNPHATALLNEDDTALTRIAAHDMATFIPDLEGRTREVSVVRRALAVPAHQVGGFAKVGAVRRAAAEVRGLHLVGDYLRSPLVEGAIRSTDDLFA